MGKRSLANGVVGVLAITAVIGCGEQFTLIENATSGSGSSGSGGASGSTSGTSSSTGMNQCTPACAAGSYCKQGMPSTCTSCTDFADFKFGAPRKIDLTLPGGASAPSYPRIGPEGQLLFTFTSQTNNPDIGHATADGPLSSLKWTMVTPEMPPINSTAQDAASFYLPKEHGNLLVGVADGTLQTNADIVLYQSDSQGSTKIVAFNPGQKIVASVALKNSTINSNIAISYTAPAPRFWSISNPSTMPLGLVTALPGAAPVAVPIHDAKGCPVDDKIAPWVTPNGQWLFFSARELDKDNGCKPVAGADTYRLYRTALNTEGQQSDTAAIEIVFPSDTKGHATPSLSPDLCMIFFTEQFETPTSELYAATRE